MDDVVEIEVDGIVSRCSIFFTTGPMFSLKSDPLPGVWVNAGAEEFRQRWDLPPTEDELDYWVWEGTGDCLPTR